MTEPAQVAKSVTHVPGRKCNPCIGTFKKRTGSGSKANRTRIESRKSRVNTCKSIPAVQQESLAIRTDAKELEPMRNALEAGRPRDALFDFGWETIGHLDHFRTRLAYQMVMVVVVVGD